MSDTAFAKALDRNAVLSHGSEGTAATENTLNLTPFCLQFGLVDGLKKRVISLADRNSNSSPHREEVGR
jgi:hypothetical protein